MPIKKGMISFLLKVTCLRLHKFRPFLSENLSIAIYNYKENVCNTKNQFNSPKDIVKMRY